MKSNNVPSKTYLALIKSRLKEGCLSNEWKNEPHEIYENIAYILEPEWVLVSERLPEEDCLCEVTFVPNPDQAPPHDGQVVEFALFHYDLNHGEYTVLWNTTDYCNFEATYGKVIAWKQIHVSDPYVPPEE